MKLTTAQRRALSRLPMRHDEWQRRVHVSTARALVRKGLVATCQFTGLIVTAKETTHA